MTDDADARKGAPESETPAPDAEAARSESYPVDGPVELDLKVGVGRIDVELIEPASGLLLKPGAEVRVEVRHDPAAGQPWTQGIASALSWVNEQFGDQFDAELLASASAAVEQTRIELLGDRLVVRAPKTLPLRHLPLAVSVRAPAGSKLHVRASAARVTVTGTAHRADVSTTSGDVALERADGPVMVRTGSGAVSLGSPQSELQVRTGGGEVRAAEIRGEATVMTGTGAVRIGSVDGALEVRSGSGDVSVADAAAGTVDLKTGSGDVRVGLHAGVLAEVELSSSTGTTSSELPVSETRPEGEVALRVRARTGSGSVVVSAAS